MGNEDMDDTKFMALEWHCLNNIQVSCRFQDIDSWWPSIISDGTECGGKWVVTIVENVESSGVDADIELVMISALYSLLS